MLFVDKMNRFVKELRLFSAMISGGLKRYRIYVSWTGNESYYTKSGVIVVGLDKIGTEDSLTDNDEIIGKALVSHEMGHHRFSDFDCFPSPATSSSVLNSLINIAEDQRIETMMVQEYPKLREYFSFLHQCSYEKYYEGREGSLSNLINLLILQRWKRWNVDVRGFTPKEEKWVKDKFTSCYPQKFNEYLLDWDKVLFKAETAPATKEVVEAVKPFYEKWKSLLETFSRDVDNVQQDIGLDKIPSMSPVSSDKKVEKIINQAGLKSQDGEQYCSDPATDKRATSFFEKEPNWDYDQQLLSQLRTIVRRWKLPKQTIRKYALVGKRVSVRRIVLQKLDAMTSTKTNSKKQAKFLFVIDGSGSMIPAPFVYACHLARILSEEFNVPTILCNDNLDHPLAVNNWNKMRYYEYGGGEGLEISKPLLKKFEKAVFFTDCHIDYDSWKTLESSRKFIVAYTSGRKCEVEDVEEELRDHSLRGIVEADILTLAKRLGRFIQRV